MISGPDPGMFQDWKDWGRELVRRNQVNSLAKQIAAILVSSAGVPFAYDARKNTITLALGTIAPGDIAGLNEAVDDRVAALLVAGSNITLTYNDVANTLTIAAAATTIADGDYGDVTVSGGGTVWTIDAGVVPMPGDFQLAVSDETTALTTGTAKITFRMLYGMTLTSVRANVNTASSSGDVTVDVKKNGTTIFSTTLTIDSGEKTSLTAAVPAALSTTALADDDEITIDIVGAGTGAKGLKVGFKGVRT